MARSLHLILHVPKCAGRTFEYHLSKHLGPQRFWSPDKRTRKLPLELFARKYDARPPGPLEDVEAISGHLFGQSIEKMFPDREIKRSVIFRDPVKQILSWYNYRMMRYMSEGLKPFPFALFVKSFPKNPTANFLLERWLEKPWVSHGTISAKKKVMLLDASLSRFDRISDISEANALYAWHCEDLGIPTDPGRANTSEEWVKRTGWKPLGLSDLTDQDRALLESRFAVDRYLWKRWALKQDIVLEHTNASQDLQAELVRPIFELRVKAAKRYGW
ncbi:MAG: hypothetical protein ACK5KM_01890 [Hyphomicrobiaceae bacterium]